MSKPILCLDFDGVLHSYSSGWKGADVVSDPPVPGMVPFLAAASAKFEVHIFSSRSRQDGGQKAMQDWLFLHVTGQEYKADETISAPVWLFQIKWPEEKPPAMVTIDDRAITFDGAWPDVATLLAFKPWNKR